MIIKINFSEFFDMNKDKIIYRIESYTESNGYVIAMENNSNEIVGNALISLGNKLKEIEEDTEAIK